jgi:hypothetical protein
MTKIAAIIGGFLLMAGVALAGTVSSLGSAGNPAIGSTLPTAAVTVRHDDRGDREARGRTAQPGEDLPGPCDESEHASDARCTGNAVEPADAASAHDDRHGHHRGPGGGDQDGHRGHSGHGGDDD